MINFKDLDVLKECVGCYIWHPTLILVVMDFCIIVNHPEVTCGFQIRNYASTHSTKPLLRAVDASSKKYEMPCIIEETINDAWIYDPQRPEMTVIYWHPNGNAKSANAKDCHFHIQVHDRTRRR